MSAQTNRCSRSGFKLRLSGRLLQFFCIRLFLYHSYFPWITSPWQPESIYIFLLGLCATGLLDKTQKRAPPLTPRDIYMERLRTRPQRRSSASLPHSMFLFSIDISLYCTPVRHNGCHMASSPNNDTMILSDGWRGACFAGESYSFVSLWTSWEAHKRLGLTDWNGGLLAPHGCPAASA